MCIVKSTTHEVTPHGTSNDKYFLVMCCVINTTSTNICIHTCSLCSLHTTFIELLRLNYLLYATSHKKKKAGVTSLFVKLASLNSSFRSDNKVNAKRRRPTIFKCNVILLYIMFHKNVIDPLNCKQDKFGIRFTSKFEIANDTVCYAITIDFKNVGQITTFV